MTNPEVYPITAFFEQATAKLDLGPCGKQVISLMASTLGEYEHGTAEPEDVFQGVQGFDLSDVDDKNERRQICLRLYKAVLEDMALVLANA